MSYHVEDDDEINRIDNQLPINEVLTPEQLADLKKEYDELIKAGVQPF